MAQILDYSAGYPGAAQIKRLGYIGGIRYLRKEGSSRVKPLTTAEVLDYRTHGLQLALVYQHVDKARPTQGRLAGRHDAEWAAARAREVGIEPRVIYFAVDFDAVPSTVAEYFRGAAAVLGVEKVGAYGGYKVLAYLFDQGLIRWGWQTVAWSGGRREARAHLLQKLGQITCNGISCDVNDVLKADYGQHPSPTPQEDDDMAYTEKQLEDITYRAVHNLLVDAHSEVPGMGVGAAKALRGILEGLPVTVDETALAALADPLAERLAAAGVGGGITPDQIANALRGVLAQTHLEVRQDAIETGAR